MYKKRVEGESEMKSYYEVRFDTKKGFPKSWVIHIEATAAKEAKKLVSEMWSKDSRMSDMHMFHVNVRKLEDAKKCKYHYFAICGEEE